MADKENSSRKRSESDSHRDRKASKDHHHRSKHDDHHHRHRTDREGSRDRDVRRERERERSPSVERKKRKERGESEERTYKRTRVHEDNIKEKRRFEDDKNGIVGESFGSKGKSVKNRDSGKRGENASSGANGVATEPITTLPIIAPETHVAHSDSPTIKVSSTTKTNENKGVNSNRFHEVIGKSSTDGITSDVGKSGGLSLDALAKAKKALQMQKELAQKMKKIPSLNRDAGSKGDGSARIPTHVPVVPAGVVPKTSTLPILTSTSVTPMQSAVPHLPEYTPNNYEAVKRAHEVAAKLGFTQDPEFAPLINMFPGQMAPEVTIQPKPSKAPKLLLDALGREVDEHGNLVNVPKVNSLSTLKVNINKQKKEAFQILKPELNVDPDQNPHFDARMGIDKNKLLRPKKMSFQFVDEGKWSKEAAVVKLKAQFGEAKAKELKAKQVQLAKLRAEPDINPNLIEVGERVIIKEKPKEPIPDVEWWDVLFLQSGTYGDMVVGDISDEKIKMEKITRYVEHPRPINPPAEPVPPPPQPGKLTKKEQKKFRTQRRLEREKEKQEMIRLGVLEPPKPKVKMSNLMKVLGSEATQDPTRLEMEIRSAAAEREQAHTDRNIARKLTPAERREKKERKLFDDPNAVDTIVSVYKMNDLSHPQARFKVDINAQENRLTGCAMISEGISVVVVEGGAKPIKRYAKLMLRRIDWTASAKKEEEDEYDDGEKPLNRCLLVWQGSVAKPSFKKFFVQECRTEASARKFFSDHGVAHYWDLAVNFTEETM